MKPGIETPGKQKPKIMENFDVYFARKDCLKAVFSSVGARFEMRVHNPVLFTHLLYLMNGNNSIEEICSKAKIGRTELERLVSCLDENGVLCQERKIKAGKTAAELRGEIGHPGKDLFKGVKVFGTPRAAAILSKITKGGEVYAVSLDSTAKQKKTRTVNPLGGELPELLENCRAVFCCLNSTYEGFQERINKECVKRRIGVVNLQLDGMLGPTYDSRSESCFSCYVKRKEENELKKIVIPVIAKKEYSSLELPDDAVKKAIGEGITELENLKKGRPAFRNHVKLLAQEKKEYVIPNPGCNFPKRSKKSQRSRKLAIKSRRISFRENGWRIASAKKTIKKAEKLIGPIGIVSKVTQERHPVIETMNVFAYDARDPEERHAGKGFTSDQKTASAILEAVERFSARQSGTEQLVKASYSELKKSAANPAVDPKKVLLGNWKNIYKYNAEREIEWFQSYCLNDLQGKLVPAPLVFLDYYRGKGAPFLRGMGAGSTGLAAGNCLEEAILHAIFELVERDSVIIVHQNRFNMPDLNLQDCKSRQINEFLDMLNGKGFAYRVKDLTLDIPIPTIGVFLHKVDEEGICSFGAGTHFDPEIALSRALQEAVQASSYSGREPWNRFGSLEHFKAKGPEGKGIGEINSGRFKNLKKALDKCVEIFDQRGEKILVADLSKPGIGFSVVRAMAPSLQQPIHPLNPVFSKRLFEAAEKRGHSKIENKRKIRELNYLPGYHSTIDWVDWFSNKYSENKGSALD